MDEINERYLIAWKTVLLLQVCEYDLLVAHIIDKKHLRYVQRAENLNHELLFWYKTNRTEWWNKILYLD